MKKCVLVVLSNPVLGREREYNEWYTNQHLGDVMQVAGVQSAQRLKAVGGTTGGQTYQYCALYGVEHENPQDVVAELMIRSGTDRMPISKAIDLNAVSAVLYELMPGGS